MQKLKDVCTLRQIKRLYSKDVKIKKQSSGNVKIFTAGLFEGYTTKEQAGDIIHSGEVIVISNGGNCNIRYYNGDFITAKNYIVDVEEGLLAKYLFYYLQNNRDTVQALYKGWGVKLLKAKDFLNLDIFVPSIEKQKQIVCILDMLTHYTNNYNTNLNDKTSQFEAIREQLFDFESGIGKKLLNGQKVEWKKLGNSEFFEIANSGRKPVKSDLRISGNIPYYGANNIQDYVEDYTHDGEYVLIAEDGSASLENYSIQYANGKFWANNHVHVIRGTSEVNTRYLYHYLRIVNFIPFLSGGGRAKLTKGKMVDVAIPIPPISVQREIVEILDKFDSLTQSLTEGLPREIELRQKQYEYYRNELLNL